MLCCSLDLAVRFKLLLRSRHDYVHLEACGITDRPTAPVAASPRPARILVKLHHFCFLEGFICFQTTKTHLCQHGYLCATLASLFALGAISRLHVEYGTYMCKPLGGRPCSSPLLRLADLSQKPVRQSLSLPLATSSVPWPQSLP